MTRQVVGNEERDGDLTVAGDLPDVTVDPRQAVWPVEP